MASWPTVRAFTSLWHVASKSAIDLPTWLPQFTAAVWAKPHIVFGWSSFIYAEGVPAFHFVCTHIRVVIPTAAPNSACKRDCGITCFCFVHHVHRRSPFTLRLCRYLSDNLPCLIVVIFLHHIAQAPAAHLRVRE